METRIIRSQVKADDCDGRLRINIPLVQFYDGTPDTEQEIMLDVIERFSPDCFGVVDYIDDDCHIRSSELGLSMEVSIDAAGLLRLAGRPVTSSVVFRPTLIEWEIADDGKDIRWIKRAELLEVAPNGGDETDPHWLPYWRMRRTGGCEKMTQEFAGRTMALSYHWSEASEAAIRETYSVEAV